MIERKVITETQLQEPALDAHWYPRLVEFGSFEAFDFLGGDSEKRAEQKRAFLEDEIQNPILDYPKLDERGLADLAARREGLLALKSDILAEEPNETVASIYRWKLNEKLAEIGMLQSAARGDMHSFMRYGLFIYGPPSKDVFGYGVGMVHEELKSLDHSDKKKRGELADRLSKAFRKKHIQKINPPNQKILKRLRNQTLKEFGEFFPQDGNGFFNGEEIAMHFSQVLQDIGAGDWSVSIDRSQSQAITGKNITSTEINVSQERKSVTVPIGRVLTRPELYSLTVHEIGTHVARRINGENSKLKLPGIGLDRYEPGEEGVAKAREQAIDGEVYQFSLPERQLAISLAYGLDGKIRDFRSVFEIMTDYFLLQSRSNEGLGKNGKTKARKKAYDLCVRVFRGTDCETKGACFLKDKGYTEGNVNVWQEIQKNPKIIVDFSVGKFDPSNKRHKDAINTLGSN